MTQSGKRLTSLCKLESSRLERIFRSNSCPLTLLSSRLSDFQSNLRHHATPKTSLDASQMTRNAESSDHSPSVTFGSFYVLGSRICRMKLGSLLLVFGVKVHSSSSCAYKVMHSLKMHGWKTL